MLNPTAYQILIGLGLVLAIISLIKPNTYLVSTGMILVCSALLAGKAQ